MLDSERVKKEAEKFYEKHKQLKEMNRPPHMFTEMILMAARILDGQSLILKKLEKFEND